MKEFHVYAAFPTRASTTGLEWIFQAAFSDEPLAHEYISTLRKRYHNSREYKIEVKEITEITHHFKWNDFCCENCQAWSPNAHKCDWNIRLTQPEVNWCLRFLPRKSFQKQKYIEMMNDLLQQIKQKPVEWANEWRKSR